MYHSCTIVNPLNYLPEHSVVPWHCHRRIFTVVEVIVFEAKEYLLIHNDQSHHTITFCDMISLNTTAMLFSPLCKCNNKKKLNRNDKSKPGTQTHVKIFKSLLSVKDKYDQLERNVWLFERHVCLIHFASQHTHLKRNLTIKTDITCETTEVQAYSWQVSFNTSLQ